MDGRKPQYTLAFVGANCSGKSSLVRRMLFGKFTEPQAEIVNDPRLGHIPQKARLRLLENTTTDFDPFYRVPASDHVYWNEYLIFNLFDMMPMKGGKESKGVLKGLSFADGAVLMLDISSFLVANRHQVAEEIIGKSLLTIFSSSSVLKDLIVVVNKMDVVDYSLELFDFVKTNIENCFKQIPSFRKIALKIIPMSIKYEENVVRSTSFENKFDSFLSCLKKLKPYERDPNAPFRMVFFDCYSMYGLGRIVTGKVITGTLIDSEEFEICQCTLRKTFKCTSQGQTLRSFDVPIVKSIAGELLSCNLYRGWSLINYSDYYGPMTFFNAEQTTCKPCTSYFTVKLTGPICRMRLTHRRDELLLTFFGYKSHVSLISTSRIHQDGKEYVNATLLFKDKNPAFTLEPFNIVEELSRVALVLDGYLIGYGVVTDINPNKNYSICHSFLYSALVDSPFQDISFQSLSQ